MSSETNQYEQNLKNQLKQYFREIEPQIDPPIPIESQWIPFRGEAVNKYSPRVGIAVGPFAYGTTEYIEKYDEMSDKSSQLINNLLDLFSQNSEPFSFESEIPCHYTRLNGVNRNARCFMAIEIEKSGTRKHRLGDIINACSLGRIGIIIAWDNSVLNSFLKITEYLCYLKSKMKPTYETRNLIITTKEQFSESLSILLN